MRNNDSISVLAFCNLLDFLQASCILYRATMNLEQQIRQLCRSIIASNSDAQAIEIARELKPLLERRLVELRASSDGAPAHNTP
jgi:hypothetical protein